MMLALRDDYHTRVAQQIGNRQRGRRSIFQSVSDSQCSHSSVIAADIENGTVASRRQNEAVGAKVRLPLVLRREGRGFRFIPE